MPKLLDLIPFDEGIWYVIEKLFLGDKKGREQQKEDADAVRSLVSPLIESEDGQRDYPALCAALDHPNRFQRERIQRIIYADAYVHLFGKAGDKPKKPGEDAREALRDGIL